ncbi:hypothetical protein MIND_01276900 [Mycena indigotica]|uniref:Uncharacterized protein n=1 Tax=Mycena indigotica TaxID=2126181 RepID=A0A8H6VX20_9AGAR|nr:uncharacterized protein MIND_01276900 [Mycena indigotica]KAF7291324.1 hypothetical protein MIND_01276900 [Mycena indigotica]
MIAPPPGNTPLQPAAAAGVYAGNNARYGPVWSNVFGDRKGKMFSDLEACKPSVHNYQGVFNGGGGKAGDRSGTCGEGDNTCSWRCVTYAMSQGEYSAGTLYHGTASERKDRGMKRSTFEMSAS